MAYKQKEWSPFTKLSEAEKEMKRLKNQYESLDTSNPYANMENVYEDLSIDQRAHKLSTEQSKQNQANILSGMRGGASSSGMAGVARELLNESEKASKKAANKIGKQEKENQAKKTGMAANIQGKEREGDIKSRKMKKEKISTLLGMSQQELAAEREKKATAKGASWDALASGVSSTGSIITGGDSTPFTQRVQEMEIKHHIPYQPPFIEEPISRVPGVKVEKPLQTAIHTDHGPYIPPKQTIGGYEPIIKKPTLKELNENPNVKQQVYLFGNPKWRIGSFKKKKK